MNLKFTFLVCFTILIFSTFLSTTDSACVVTRRTVRSYGYILPVGSGKNGPKLSDDDLITFEEGTEVDKDEPANAKKYQRQPASSSSLSVAGPVAALTETEDGEEDPDLQSDGGKRHGNRSHGRGRGRARYLERKLKNRGRNGRQFDDD